MKNLYNLSNRKEQVVSVFLDLVKLSSPSKQEQLVANYIKDYLKKYDFVEVVEDDTALKIGGTTNNLIVRIKGRGKHILFDAHMDTVQPCMGVKPKVIDGKITSDGTTILGADDKSGIAAMLVLVDVLSTIEYHNTITLLFTVCEEDSLQGAKNLDYNLISGVDYAYVLDGEGPVGTIITKTPYGCKGKLSMIGKEAHAGVEPENGVNALYVASQAISKLPMGRINDQTTCNIGVVQGGTATNVVMGEVHMMFEARSYELAQLEQLIKEVKQTYYEVANTYGAIFEEILNYGTPGYCVESEEEIVQNFKEACVANDIPYNEISCGGGSNANVYRTQGIEALTLSTNMKDCHSCNESIEENDLLQLLKIITYIAVN